jgi:hypothetical protein
VALPWGELVTVPLHQHDPGGGLGQDGSGTDDLADRDVLVGSGSELFERVHPVVIGREGLSPKRE